MRRALVRPISESFAQCRLTFIDRVSIDVALARRQHAAYVRTLDGLGLEVIGLPPEDALPDATFVEDTMVVLDECGIVMAMGSEERQPEVESAAAAIGRFRRLSRLEAPARMDGGDVLRIGRDIFAGRSARTNDEGIDQLTRLTRPLGYRVIPVDVPGCLHLKTGCTHVGRHVLINDAWVDPEPFAHLDVLLVPESEPHGANTLSVGDTVLVSASCPETERLLRARGCATIAINISEIEKAEAGLTCLSVLFAAE